MSRVVDVLLPVRLGTAYRRLVVASWTNTLGDGIAYSAGPLLVASLTRNPVLVSLGALMSWAPPLVFGLWAGLLSDRVDRRAIVVAANLARAATIGVLVLALAAGTAPVALVLGVLGLLATADVFANNTTQTLLPMLVACEDLPLGNSRLQFGFVTLNRLVGPSLGAALFTAGRTWPFLTELLLVLAAVTLLSRLRLPPLAVRTEHQVRRDLVDGLTWTARHPAVRTLVLTILVFNVAFGASWSVLVLYASDRLGLGSFGFGLLTTIEAAGGIVAGFGYGALTRRFSLGALMRIGLVLETLMHLALATTTSAPFAIVVFFVLGAHEFVWGTTSVTIRQREVPHELQGRVGSLYQMAVFGGLVVGSVVGGLVASRFGVTAPFWFGFASAGSFLVLLWRQLLLVR